MRIDEALLDPNLLGAALGDPATWASWLTVLKAANGVALDEDEALFFDAVSGGREPPRKPVKETWLIQGRRSGKSRVAGSVAVYEGAMKEHRLAPGEIGVVLVLSASRAQARTVFNYCLGYLRSAPLLAQQIESVTATEIRLTGGVVIEVHTNNFRTVRGRTILACIYDEIAFWRDESSASPDKEVHRAIMPALAASNGPLVAISTPYRRSGLLHEKHRAYFGVDDEDVLVIQGASTAFNPTLSRRMIDRAMADDPESGSAEWLACFRSDIAAFLDDDLIEAAIDRDRPRELPPRSGITYSAAVDASGGRSDSFTCCIGHKQDDGHFVADVVRGVTPPFHPGSVTAQFAALVREYSCRQVVGDNYSADWVASAFREQGLDYARSDLPASGLYIEALPAFTRNALSIPDHAPLIRELRGLERRTSRMGKDQVTHSAGAHDDHANVLALCLRIATKPSHAAFVCAIRGGF